MGQESCFDNPAVLQNTCDFVSSWKAPLSRALVGAQNGLGRPMRAVISANKGTVITCGGLKLEILKFVKTAHQSSCRQDMLQYPEIFRVSQSVKSSQNKHFKHSGKQPVSSTKDKGNSC